MYLSIGIYWYYSMAMKKVMVSLPDEMVDVLDKERKERFLETIPETIRVILGDYLRTKFAKKTSVTDSTKVVIGEFLSHNGG
jgi:metal-responsive CopG/Arc/MetJ family transcriptional regulator